MKRIYLLLLLPIAILPFLALPGCGGGGGGTSVTVDTVQQRNIIESVSASGKIQPEVEVKMSSDVSGQIVQLLVKEGDSVKQGQLLLEINPDLYESEFARMQAVLNQTKANLESAKSQVSQMEAQLLLAEENWNRQKGLYDKKAISKAEYDQANTNYKVAQSQLDASKKNMLAADYTVKSTQAALKSANDNLRRTKIFSPMNGVVSKLNMKLGERVVGTAQMQGTELLRIADLSRMEVVVEVNENDIVKIDFGDTAVIEVDAYLNRKFTGIVTSIANSPKSSTNVTATDEVTNFEVKVRILPESYKDLLQDGQVSPFRPGMSATVDIHTDRVSGVNAVPIQSVTTRKDTVSGTGNEYKEYVFVIDGKKVKLTEVETGVQDNKYIQVVKGLEVGQVVVEGPYNTITKLLEDGTKVRIKSKEDMFKKGK